MWTRFKNNTLLYKIECFIVSGVAPSAMNVSIAQNVSDIFNFTIAGKCLIVLKHLINSCVLDIEAHNSTWPDQLMAILFCNRRSW